MFQVTDHDHSLSLRLSEVLSDIGVNERILTMRRKIPTLLETMYNIDTYLRDVHSSTFRFGSQTEGSTTPGLQSDHDNLIVSNSEKAIQDWPEWEPGKRQWMMIQNDRTSHGYCLLQVLRRDEPLPVQDNNSECYATDDEGRVLLRHSYLVGHADEGLARHGPAQTVQARSGDRNTDIVFAICCSAWPKEALPWLQQRSVCGWPTIEMKSYAERQGCFVVPVASKTGIYPDLEWRISTAHAERCLMLNLNMTQMRCYILMKMMLKTFIEPKCKDIISSFICKNLLFQCIAETPAAVWTESLTVQRLKQCLDALLHSVLTSNCPHFIIPGNNLLAGKLTVAVQRQLAEILCGVSQNIEQSFLRINIDDIGERLRIKSGGLRRRYFHSRYEVAHSLALDLVMNFSAEFLNFHHFLFYGKNNLVSANIFDTLTHKLIKLLKIYRCGDKMAQLACRFHVPLICTQLGSCLASKDIEQAGAISHQALTLFSLGLKLDASTSRLKLASAFYCSGDMMRCEFVLSAFKRQVEQTPTCSCCCCRRPDGEREATKEFVRVCYEKHEQAVKENLMFCVRHLPCEKNCIPKELLYEMFRSTQDDQQYRNDSNDWMDWAVVDSVPYLYFLQYKVYRELQRPADQQEALDNLIQTINTEANIFHRETAYNLLGQCMEQEDRRQDAINCYWCSLKIWPRNNAAKWHICRYMAFLIRNQK